jgi:hypothetical protein
MFALVTKKQMGEKSGNLKKKIAKNLKNIHQHFKTTKLKKHNGKAGGMFLQKKRVAQSHYIWRKKDLKWSYLDISS